MEKLEFTELKYPEMRQELISYLEGLSDFEYQKDVWVKKNPREGVVNDEMDYAVHFIFDDTCLASDPDGAVGLYLKNSREVEAVSRLVHALDSLFDLYGVDLSDAEYIEKMEWQEVLSCAIQARAIIS